MLGLAATVAVVCLGAVVREGSGERRVSSVERTALLQSRMNVLRERDFAEGKQLAGIVHSLTTQALAPEIGRAHV